MPGTLSDEIKSILVNERVAGSTFSDLFLHLLVGAVPSITHATVYTDLSPYLPSWSGYATQPIGTWGAASLTGDFHALAQAALVTFLNSAISDTPSVVAWMMYSTFGAVSRLVCAQAFGTPFVIPASGNYQTNPTWQDTGE